MPRTITQGSVNLQFKVEWTIKGLDPQLYSRDRFILLLME